MVLKRCTKRGRQELLERQRASAWIHVIRGHRATDHGELSILARNVRGWEEGRDVEVRFSLISWLACTCALDLTLDTARKEEFATQRSSVVAAPLVSACKIQQADSREMLDPCAQRMTHLST
jgi:hypothetical protein